MKRHTFLKSGLSLAGIWAVPTTLFAKAKEQFRTKTGFRVEKDKDRMDKPLLLFDGDTFTCKISTADTDGEMYVYESLRVKEGGPALHMHFEQDEWWYVLQGQFTIKVGDDVYEAKAGDTVFGPRMVPHTFAKTGSEPGKMIMGFRPAGKMEAFFNKVAGGILKGIPEAEQDKIRQEHGFKRMGPPLQQLKL